MARECYYILAGETSADLLAVHLMRAVEQNVKQPVNWIGIGGEQMQNLGLSSNIPFTKLSVIGILDAISSYNTLLQIAKEQVKQIIQHRPKAIFTVDTKQFSLKFISRLRKEMDKVGWHVPIIQLVAPTVWAWGAWRTKKFEQLFDAILCLFPFEPSYFDPKRTYAVFVGHPEAYNFLQTKKPTFPVLHPKGADVIGLLPGSRRGEIEFSLNDIICSAELFARRFPKCRFVLPTTSNLEKAINDRVKNIQLPIEIVVGKNAFENSLSKMSAAICVSGTATLQLGLSGVPAVTCYKTNNLNFLIMRLLFKQKDPILPNILLQKKVYPCYLQAAQTPTNLSSALIDIYENISAHHEVMKLNAIHLRHILISEKESFEASIAHHLNSELL